MIWWILMTATVILFLVLWVRAVIDAWGRADLSRAAKAAWTIIMFVFPFVGLLFYTLIRPSDTQVAERASH